jgi:DNA replication protein DnaC
MHCDKHDLEYEQVEKELFGKKMLFGTCPACDIEYEEETRKAQEEREEQSRIYGYERSNIEPMYFSATLDGFNADTPELVKAKETVQRLIATKSGKIVMLGKNGTGKTHLAVCAVKALGGKIYTMYEISTRIRATYTAKAKEDELDVTDELARVKMLVIDEIGRTKGSEAEENWLSYIIDKRNSRSLPLILISNKHSRKSCPEKGCKDCIENYLSEDILSRLCVDGKMLNFTGDDYRKRR